MQQHTIFKFSLKFKQPPVDFNLFKHWPLDVNFTVLVFFLTKTIVYLRMDWQNINDCYSCGFFPAFECWNHVLQRVFEGQKACYITYEAVIFQNDLKYYARPFTYFELLCLHAFVLPPWVLHVKLRKGFQQCF